MPYAAPYPGPHIGGIQTGGAHGAAAILQGPPRGPQGAFCSSIQSSAANGSAMAPVTMSHAPLNIFARGFSLQGCGPQPGALQTGGGQGLGTLHIGGGQSIGGAHTGGGQGIGGAHTGGGQGIGGGHTVGPQNIMGGAHIGGMH